MSFIIPQIAQVINGPHLMFNGANGYKCFGIGVKSLEDGSKSGFSNEWNINSFSVLNQPYLKEFLGLSDQEYLNILKELAELEKQNIVLRKDDYDRLVSKINELEKQQWNTH